MPTDLLQLLTSTLTTVTIDPFVCNFVSVRCLVER